MLSIFRHCQDIYLRKVIKELFDRSCGKLLATLSPWDEMFFFSSFIFAVAVGLMITLTYLDRTRLKEACLRFEFVQQLQCQYYNIHIVKFLRIFNLISLIFFFQVRQWRSDGSIKRIRISTVQKHTQRYVSYATRFKTSPTGINNNI